MLVWRGVVAIGDGPPETLLMGATGRPVADFVDHPFLRDGPVIGSAGHADPAECSFLEIVRPALFLREVGSGTVEAFEAMEDNSPRRSLRSED